MVNLMNPRSSVVLCVLSVWCFGAFMSGCSDNNDVAPRKDMTTEDASPDLTEDMSKDMPDDKDMPDPPDMKDMPKDIPVLDMCEPEDVTNFCQGKCGMQTVKCTDNPQTFDCGPCEVAKVEILEPVPKPDGELFINLGKDPVPLDARALDDQGMEVPCNLVWSVQNTTEINAPDFAKIVERDDGQYLQPVAEGSVTLKASCNMQEADAKLRMILPGYLPKATAFKVWLRPEDGLQTNASNQVVAWENSVVDGPDFKPPGMARPLIERKNLEGFDTVSFSGQNALVVDVPNGDPFVRFNQTYTLFSVLKADLARPLGSQVIFGGCDADGSYQIRLQANVTNTLSYYHQLDPDNKPDEFVTSAASPIRLADQFILLTVHVDGKNLRIRLNGQTVYVDDKRFLGMGRQFNVNRIGSWCQETAGFQGQIAEVLMYEVAFDENDDLDYRAQIENYLMLKYNLF